MGPVEPARDPLDARVEGVAAEKKCRDAVVHERRAHRRRLVVCPRVEQQAMTGERACGPEGCERGSQFLFGRRDDLGEEADASHALRGIVLEHAEPAAIGGAERRKPGEEQPVDLAAREAELAPEAYQPQLDGGGFDPAIDVAAACRGRRENLRGLVRRLEHVERRVALVLRLLVEIVVWKVPEPLALLLWIREL